LKSVLKKRRGTRVLPDIYRNLDGKRNNWACKHVAGLSIAFDRLPIKTGIMIDIKFRIAIYYLLYTCGV